MQGPIVFLNVAANFEHNLNILCQVCRGHLVRCNDHVSVVYWLGNVWGIVHCFGFGWGGPVTLTRSGLWRVCPHLCWEKVLISSSFVF